ncbi:MAG: DEAD/DEAH box helicase, partial [Lachnospiraceae bacterium]|nr:DEAD/DEAH box helicase [Lachnospiraceae bacterium]
MNLGTDVSHLKGVGEKTAALFKKLNIQTYEDLFSYYPTDYIRYNPPVSFSDLRAGSVFTVRGLAASVSGPVKAGRYSIITVILKDGLNTLEAVFFNQTFIKKVIKVGGYYILRGKIVQKGAKLIMQSPKLFKEDEYRELVKYPQAKYSLTAGLSSKTVSKALKAAFTGAQWPEECFPKKYLESLNLPSHKDAIRLIHFPECDEDIAFARRRLSFEEFFYFIMLLRKNKQISVSTPNNFRMIETAETKRFLESLPFKPTAGQKKAWKDILDDMCGERCMNRLIQGDVGSGKTLIALLSLLLAASNGYQGALMAPTEVLAVQHFKTVNEYISKYGLIFKPVLLTGQMKAADRREALAKIESGEANLIIGTHALIQEKVSYKNL